MGVIDSTFSEKYKLIEKQDLLKNNLKRRYTDYVWK